MGLLDDKIQSIEQAEELLKDALRKSDEQLAKNILKIYAKFVVNGDLVLNAEELAKLDDSIIAAIKSTDYKLAIDAYVPNFEAIQLIDKDIHKELNGIDAAKVIAENEKIANYQSVIKSQLRGTNVTNLIVDGKVTSIPNKSLNKLLDPIADIIRTDVITGVSFEEAAEQVLDAINKGDLGLQQWAGQISRDALSQASGITNDEIRKEFDMKYVTYVGTIKQTTRPLCYHFLTDLDGSVKFEDLQKELNKFVPGGVPSSVETTDTANSKPQKKGNGIIPGTAANNFLIRRGGYNCRHEAIPSVKRPIGFVEKELEDQPIDEPKKAEFKPAKSIKEAQEFALENDLFTRKVQYNKIDIDYANEVNKTLLKLKNEHGVIFDDIITIKQKTATGASAPMTHEAIYENGVFKRSVLKINGGTAIYLKNNKEWINRKYPDLKLNITDSDFEIINKWYKENNRNGYWVAENVEQVINHEYGHLLTQVEGSVIQAQARQKAFRGKVYGVKNISQYAGFSQDEALAEIFSLYKKEGVKNLTKKQIEFFNNFSNKVKIK